MYVRAYEESVAGPTKAWKFHQTDHFTWSPHYQTITFYSSINPYSYTPVTQQKMLNQISLQNLLKFLIWQSSIRFIFETIIIDCCIFLPAFGCCAPQTLVEICIFNIFNDKKLNKGEKSKKFNKKVFFKVTPKRWSSDGCAAWVCYA